MLLKYCVNYCIDYVLYLKIILREKILKQDCLHEKMISDCEYRIYSALSKACKMTLYKGNK
ncbi:hypothetical protein AGMMS49925_02720 [Deltaproteobacteria bacterium]|nr:hypothetical protein AGMMS49925_02720 [Deltaproteobacteria bacterium]